MRIITPVAIHAMLIILIACTYAPEATPAENGTIKTCFSMQEDCETRLAELISSSAHVKTALYDLDAPRIITALKDKDTDLLIDEDNYEDYGQEIKSPGLMHNKFFILHNASGNDYVITGSTNPTRNGFLKNDNNMIIINSLTLANNYEEEFYELKEGRASRKTTYTRIIFNGHELENYFCPEDNCEDEVLEELEAANESVHFMTFSFTSDNIGKLLMKRKEELDIKGVFDKSQSASNREYSEYPWMKEAGMDVKLSDGKGKMHHKVFIIDNKTVITGSYNPTASGNAKNDENMLVIREPAIVEKYLKEFERVWSES
ncbi:DUF1669 domain-containing protein [Candidatus Woesearchaeota archaeon]|nr:DUF1669 domain-containing protein [Candidatus Woesearchaeota archaeon]